MKARIWMNNRPTGHKVSEYAEVEVLGEFKRFGKEFIVHHEVVMLHRELREMERFQVSEKSTGVRVSNVYSNMADAILDAREMLRVNKKSGLRKFLADTRKTQHEKLMKEVEFQLTK